MSKYVLYVGRDRKRRDDRHDLGSLLCLRLLELLPPRTVEVREVPPGTAPSMWLRGTPTLITPTDDALQGHRALSMLQELAVTLARLEGEQLAGHNTESSGGHVASARNATNVGVGVATDALDESVWTSGSHDESNADADDEEDNGKVSMEVFARVSEERNRQNAAANKELSSGPLPPAFQPIKD